MTYEHKAGKMLVNDNTDKPETPQLQKLEQRNTSIPFLLANSICLLWSPPLLEWSPLCFFCVYRIAVYYETRIGLSIDHRISKQPFGEKCGHYCDNGDFNKSHEKSEFIAIGPKYFF